VHGIIDREPQPAQAAIISSALLIWQIQGADA
jgi:hypothetical protein